MEARVRSRWRIECRIGGPFKNSTPLHRTSYVIEKQEVPMKTDIRTKREERMAGKLDEIDVRMLKVLQTNSRIPVLELAEHAGLSATPCSRRLRRLEEEGIIQRYCAEIDPAVLGLELTAFVNIQVQHSAELAAEFRDAIMKLTNVRGCYLTAGDYDYLLWVRAKDMASLSTWITERLHSIPSVRHTYTIIVLETVKDDPISPVGDFVDAEGRLA
jgi:Lrp/AsnC family leucine-responsive transcriptional regulator